MDLSVRDQKSIWHPYAPSVKAALSLPIVSGKGTYVFAEDGSAYLDAISSWWVNLHGHAHPYIIEKITRQLEQLEHVVFTDFTHPSAIYLAERLLKLVPGNMSKVFYSDNGSTAVEVGIKMALHTAFLKNPESKRQKVVAFKNGMHGDTFLGMSLGSKNDIYRPFWPYLFDVEVIDPPLYGYEEEALHQLQSIDHPVCFIFEPILQGFAGMLPHNPLGLDALLTYCREREIVTIADEVLTGFGRTGPLFATERLKEEIDIVCLSKGMTGGFFPLGATLCKPHIAEAFSETNFFHGHSFTGHPVACAAALASLDLLEDPICTEQRHKIEQSHRHFAEQIKGHLRCKRVHVTGTIISLEYAYEGEQSYYAAKSIGAILKQFFLEKHILMRPLGNIIYILPPYCISQEDLDRIYAAIFEVLEKKEWN